MPRITWPPPANKKARIKGNTRQKYDGEPSIICLDRWPNDSALRGSERVACCDCGLIHLYTYETVRGGDNKFYLIRRAHRIDGIILKKARQKARRRKK